MTSEVEAIVKADRAAQRELDAVGVRLAARAREEADRQARERAAAETAARERMDAEAAALKREGDARLAAARAARLAHRNERRMRAAASFEPAVAAYLAIVNGNGP